MNTKLNTSDWIILAFIFGVTVILNSIDYYREGNKLIEYLVDFPSSIFFSLIMILGFVQFLVPQFLIKRKAYIVFFILGILLLTICGTMDNIIGRFTAGKDLSGITNILLYLQNGLYNASDMIGFPLGIVLMKKFYEGQTLLVKSEKQQKENELKLLRSQIDPHFLFNNLNTLDSLIDSDAEKAKEYINRLSLIYRYLIKTKDSEVMELSEEMEHAENYFFLIETRFGSDYKFTIEKQTSLADKFIPTGAIQTLLENVVKHNKPRNGMTIEATILIDENGLKITNDKSSLASKTESFGTGLENLKARYKLLSDKEIWIKNSDKTFEVSIPIIGLSE
jgi:sensor histidine kinase YesM